MFRESRVEQVLALMLNKDKLGAMNLELFRGLIVVATQVTDLVLQPQVNKSGLAVRGGGRSENSPRREKCGRKLDFCHFANIFEKLRGQNAIKE